MAAGELADAWSANWPVEPGNLLVRRDAVVAVGGWPAAVSCTDLGLLLRVSEEFSGLVTPVQVWSRREWDGQVSRSGDLTAVTAAESWALAHALNVRRTMQWPHRPSIAAP